MSAVDQYIKAHIMEKIQQTNNPDLLDLIYKLLLSEG